MNYNKTYEFFKPAPNQSKEETNKAWRYLHDRYKNFTLDFKDRYSTVRAKQQFILSWDHSDFYGEFFVSSVPNDIKQSWRLASFIDAHTLAIKEGKFYIASKENGVNKIFIFQR